MSERSIFIAALEKDDAAERAAYLDQACAGDEVLRARIERLLKAHDPADSFLERGPAVLDATENFEPSAECAGTMIGPFKLIEPIGEGGMGSVWMAQQTEPIKRLVAVKLIKAGMDSRQVIARFEAERQALALMDHPNIARVLDAGTSKAGRPYFVMDLVKGVPITRYCDEHHLTPRQRLELFIPVCQAVQHAHQKGIIHRDLKPSNVLVAPYDGKPVVKVIDFGVAKAAGQQLTDRTLVTGFGAIVGTLEYMSPEQAELNNRDIDTRSDIYSLGVLLYELLAGSPPFSRKELTQAGMLEMLRVIREQEPSKPSTKLSTAEGLPSLAANRGTEPAKLTKLVRGELDWIVMKALEKDRGRRYETASSFAMDVQRFLSGEPVLAAPATTLYRLQKFVRRHRGPVAAAALVLLTLLGGITGTTWGLLRAEAKNREAVAQRDAKDRALKSEQQARADETKARQQAFAALRSMTTDVVERKFTQGTALTDDDRAFLRGVIAQFDGFAAINGDDADSRAVRAEGRYRVGTMRYTLGELKEAEQDYDQALSIYQQLVADFPERPEFRRELARSFNNRASLLRITGRSEAAEKDYNQTVNINKQLAADFPDRPEFRHLLARYHNNRGILLQRMGRLQAAEKDCDEALSIRKQLAADFPDRPEFRQDLANAHFTLGYLRNAAGRLKEAELDHDKAVSLRQQLADDFPNRPEFRQDLARSHNSIAGLLIAMGRVPEAAQHLNQALGIQKQLAAEFPSQPDSRQELAVSHYNRGNLLRDMGRLQDAERDFDQALSIQTQLAADFRSRPEFRQQLAGSHNNRGLLLRTIGRLQDAERDHDQALSIQQQLAADFPSRPDFRHELAMSHTNRGILKCDTGRPKEAEPDYDQAVSLQMRLAADFPNRPEFRRELARSLQYRAALRSDTGRLKEAEQDGDQAVSVLKQLAADFPSRPEFRKDLAMSHANRGVLLRDAGRPEQAELEYRQALSNLQQLAAESPNELDVQHSLAGTCDKLAILDTQRGNWAAAKRLLLEGRAHHLVALKVPEYRKSYREHLGVLTQVHAGLLEQEEALRTAEICRDLGWNGPADAYDAACSVSRCLPILAKHDKLDDKGRREAAQFYGDAAMKLLREAVSKGFKNVPHMKKDTDLDPLRQRDDFRKLIADLETAAVPEKTNGITK